MFSQNLILPPENPRPAAASFASKPMSNEIAIAAQKPPPSILVGRFKALLKQRDDELRLVAGVPVPPPTTDEIVQIYDLLLSELTCNLKPIITDLTIIAEQQREHAKGIADTICTRILEVRLRCRRNFFCPSKFVKCHGIVLIVWVKIIPLLLFHFFNVTIGVPILVFFSYISVMHFFYVLFFAFF